MKPGSLEELIYFAGFFDADGSVGIRKPHGKTTYYGLDCTVNQVVPDPLLRLKNRYGGKMVGPYTKINAPNSRPIYYWKVEAKKAEKFLLDIFPYLIVKHDRVALALEFRKLFGFTPRGISADEQRKNEILKLRKEMYEQMAVLNKRGVLSNE